MRERVERVGSGAGNEDGDGEGKGKGKGKGEGDGEGGEGEGRSSERTSGSSWRSGPKTASSSSLAASSR